MIKKSLHCHRPVRITTESLHTSIIEELIWKSYTTALRKDCFMKQSLITMLFLLEKMTKERLRMGHIEAPMTGEFLVKFLEAARNFLFGL